MPMDAGHSLIALLAAYALVLIVALLLECTDDDDQG